jgi:tol-pal system protein YbgF
MPRAKMRAAQPSRSGTMRHPLIAVFVAAVLVALAAPCASAQDYDLQQLQDRVARLERDMAALESQVYRGGGSGAPAMPPGQAAAGEELRLERFGDQLRDLTGRIEDLQHEIDEMKARADKRANDVDMRLQALEQAAGINGAAANNNPNAPPQRQNQPPEPPHQTAAMTPPAPPSGNSGAGTATPAPGEVLPSGSPQQQYNYAFGLLRDANYPAAAQALREFVRRYPASPLSSNAEYWLGETYFVRGQYQAAAAIFAEGYQKYPKGNKGADTLFKLGSSLGRMGRKSDACEAFARLDHDFPIAPANLKQKEAEEKQRAGCR